MRGGGLRVLITKDKKGGENGAGGQPLGGTIPS